ncbi:MAG: class II aldolase/adducin family protein [Calditrichaeota bacterium]|nr:MAG: class II aldolase/adducin family protein [Calditrichota bacterium]MBL1204532.1 class II aldolase/adducin family protein [Calditrichota bacterium]NOG44360.1 class II aldolase/adducin family protein [Calditrichota bacterium]
MANLITERQLKLHIVEIGKKLYSNRYIVATDGNISARIGDSIIITPSGACKGNLSADDLLVCDMSGNKIRGNGEISSEFKMHLEAYKTRPDIAAVVHAHPLYSTSFATCGLAIDEPILPEIILTLKKIPLAKYATPGSIEVGDSIKKLILSHDSILLENHGVITVADNLNNAYMHLERVEHVAQIIFLAKQMCRPTTLSPDQVDSIIKSGNG